MEETYFCGKDVCDKDYKIKNEGVDITWFSLAFFFPLFLFSQYSLSNLLNKRLHFGHYVSPKANYCNNT